ncbi:hypothetical protein [Enterococcus sp. LJL90]
MKKVYLIAVFLVSILIISGCTADTDKTTDTSVSITNSVENFDASSSQYTSKVYSNKEDIPDTLEVGGEKLTLRYIAKEDQQDSYTAYYE